METDTLTSIYPKELAFVLALSVSDNNQLAAVMSLNYVGLQLVVFDMNNKTQLAHRGIPSVSGNLQFSSDGRYIIGDSSVYYFDVDTIVKVGTVSVTAKFADGPDKIVHQSGTKLQLLQLPDMTVLREVDLGPKAYALTDFDPKTGFVGCESAAAGNYLILNMNDGSVMKSLPLNNVGNRFQNGALFNGYSYLLLFP
jgi:hypothetical protein